MVVRYGERGGRGRCVDGAHWANTGKPPVPRNPTLVSFVKGRAELNLPQTPSSVCLIVVKDPAFLLFSSHCAPVGWLRD